MVAFGMPLNLRIIGDTIEVDGEPLAVFNEQATPTRLAMFKDFIENVSDFGSSDDIIDKLFPDEYDEGENATEEKADEKARALYDYMRDRINHNTTLTLVSAPQVLYILRQILNVKPDDFDTSFSYEETEEVKDDDETSNQGVHSDA